MTRNEHIVVRSARRADEQELLALRVLDGGRHMPDGRVMVAEVDGRIRAAAGSNGVAISDPFWPSTELVGMLRLHVQADPKDRPPRFIRRPVLRAVAGV